MRTSPQTRTPMATWIRRGIERVEGRPDRLHFASILNPKRNWKHFLTRRLLMKLTNYLNPKRNWKVLYVLNYWQRVWDYLESEEELKVKSWSWNTGGALSALESEEELKENILHKHKDNGMRHPWIRRGIESMYDCKEVKWKYGAWIRRGIESGANHSTDRYRYLFGLNPKRNWKFNTSSGSHITLHPHLNPKRNWKLLAS